MEFGWKRLNRQIDEYQSELVQTHYAEVENMYRQMRGWQARLPQPYPDDEGVCGKGRFGGAQAVSG